MQGIIIQLMDHEVAKLNSLARDLDTTPTALLEALVADLTGSTRQGCAGNPFDVEQWLKHNQLRFQQLRENASEAQDIQ